MNDSADPNVGASTSGALSAYLAPVLERRDIVLDASQVAALGRLERLHDEFAEFVRARRSLLRRWFNPPIPPRGVYLWGGVGRGKSFLMDAFYAAVPLRRKNRVPSSPGLFRRVPCLGHRRRDDTRTPSRRAVQKRSGIRDDVQLPSRRSLPERAAAAKSVAHDRAAQRMARRDRDRRWNRLPSSRARATVVLLRRTGGRGGRRAFHAVRPYADRPGRESASDRRSAWPEGEAACRGPGLVQLCDAL